MLPVTNERIRHQFNSDHPNTNFEQYRSLSYIDMNQRLYTLTESVKFISILWSIINIITAYDKLYN